VHWPERCPRGPTIAGASQRSIVGRLTSREGHDAIKAVLYLVLGRRIVFRDEGEKII
jgi:hypothetical protein